MKLFMYNTHFNSFLASFPDVRDSSFKLVTYDADSVETMLRLW
jgi:hypothetical protein